jgi:hypothetical protein
VLADPAYAAVWQPIDGGQISTLDIGSNATSEGTAVGIDDAGVIVGALAQTGPGEQPVVTRWLSPTAAPTAIGVYNGPNVMVNGNPEVYVDSAGTVYYTGNSSTDLNECLQAGYFETLNASAPTQLDNHILELQGAAIQTVNGTTNQYLLADVTNNEPCESANWHQPRILTNDSGPTQIPSDGSDFVRMAPNGYTALTSVGSGVDGQLDLQSPMDGSAPTYTVLPRLEPCDGPPAQTDYDVPTGINASDVVVGLEGCYDGTETNYVAVEWDAAGTPVNLLSLIPLAVAGRT